MICNSKGDVLMAQTSITISDGLKEVVENEAKRAERSFSQQVIFILKEHYREKTSRTKTINTTESEDPK